MMRYTPRPNRRSLNFMSRRMISFLSGMATFSLLLAMAFMLSHIVGGFLNNKSDQIQPYPVHPNTLKPSTDSVDLQGVDGNGAGESNLDQTSGKGSQKIIDGEGNPYVPPPPNDYVASPVLSIPDVSFVKTSAKPVVTGADSSDLKKDSNDVLLESNADETGKPLKTSKQKPLIEEPEEQDYEGISYADFDPKGKLYFHPGTLGYSYVTNDAWRPNAAYKATYNAIQASLDKTLRPKRPPLSKFPNVGEYLKQTVVNDYANNTDKMFLMIKTGATVLWNRLPIHVATTLTRIPNFAMYADIGTSVAGYEVIDVLANITEKTKSNRQFKLYRDLIDMRDRHAIADPGTTKLSGGWELDKFKNLPMLLHAYKVAPPETEWFVFMDCDTYMMMDNLMDYLVHLNSSEPLYIGETQYLSGTPFAHGGSGVVLSRAAMDLTFGEHPEWVEESEEHALNVCCGDYMVAWLMKKIGVNILSKSDDSNDKWRQGESFEEYWLRNRQRREDEENPDPRAFHYNRVGHKFQKFAQWDLAATREEWCNKIVSFHHLSAMDIEILWEYEQLLTPERREHITYSDIYRDFVAPYIDTWMNDWNNMARQKEFSEAKDLDEEVKRIERELRHLEKAERQKKIEEKIKEVKLQKANAIASRRDKKEKRDSLIEEGNLFKRGAQEEASQKENTEEEEKQVEKKEEKPAEKKEEKPAEKKEEKPADKDEAKPADKGEEKSTDKDEEKPLTEEEKKKIKEEEEAKKKKEEEERKRKEEEEEAKKHRPWHSAEDCQKQCERDPYCSSWRYIPSENYCANDDAVRLGRPAFTYLTYDEGEKNRDFAGTISGYMIDRIRNTRRAKKCDILYNLSDEDDKAQRDFAVESSKNLFSTITTEELNQVIESGSNLGLQALLAQKEQKDFYEGWYNRVVAREKRLKEIVNLKIKQAKEKEAKAKAEQEAKIKAEEEAKEKEQKKKEEEERRQREEKINAEKLEPKINPKQDAEGTEKKITPEDRPQDSPHQEPPAIYKPEKPVVPVKEDKEEDVIKHELPQDTPNPERSQQSEDKS